jgi:antitoxin component HigA of HigAB toxin-antitoxin module
MKTATKATGRREGDSYMKLIRRHSLRPIRTEAEYDAAVKMLNELVVRDERELDRGESDYLDVLTDLVAAYDSKNHQIDTASLTPLELLNFFMDQHQMTRGELGKVLGSAPAASMILKRQRPISRAQAHKLAERFHVDYRLFL